MPSTEIGPLLAPVIATGKKFGVGTPAERLGAMIAEMESEMRDFAQDNLAELGRA
jgi:hypothetical protein